MPLGARVPVHGSEYAASDHIDLQSRYVLLPWRTSRRMDDGRAGGLRHHGVKGTDGGAQTEADEASEEHLPTEVIDQVDETPGEEPRGRLHGAHAERVFGEEGGVRA